MLFCEDFDLIQLSVNPRLTVGVLVILAKRGTLSALLFDRVAPYHSRYSCNPTKKIIFLDFLRSGTQIKSVQNTISTKNLTQTLLILSV